MDLFKNRVTGEFMKKRTELLENKKGNRELTIRKKILEFVKYYESNSPYPQNDSELTVTEIEACKLIAASIIQLKDKNDFDRTINDLGGYDKFVAKMCELASESAESELKLRIMRGMSLENIDFYKMKLNFLSVSDTIKVLLEEKSQGEFGCDR